MAEVAMQVPGGVGPGVRDTVLLLYRAAVEALHQAFGAQAETEELGEVRAQRARLRELDALLEQVGWPDDPLPRVIKVRGRAGLLRDVLYGALIDAGERLAVACSGSWRGEAGAGSVRAAAREVIEVDRLLRELETGA
jgi:hypothetical protein